MSSFVAFGPRQISLTERSHSSFALVIFFLCAGEDLPPPSDNAEEAVSGRSKSMRTGFPTGTRRRRSSDEEHSLLGRRACAYDERITSTNH
jgi:hypothetical protein